MLFICAVRVARRPSRRPFSVGADAMPYGSIQRDHFGEPCFRYLRPWETFLQHAWRRGRPVIAASVVSETPNRRVAIACVYVLACVDTGVLLVEVDRVGDFGLRMALPGALRARVAALARSTLKFRAIGQSPEERKQSNSGIHLSPDSAIWSSAKSPWLVQSSIARVPVRRRERRADRCTCKHRGSPRSADILIERYLLISLVSAAVVVYRGCMGPSIAIYLQFPESGSDTFLNFSEKHQRWMFAASIIRSAFGINLRDTVVFSSLGTMAFAARRSSYPRTASRQIWRCNFGRPDPLRP